MEKNTFLIKTAEITVKPPVKGLDMLEPRTEMNVFCGYNIRLKSKSTGCDHDCPGNRNEKCGGDWRISIYDTWPCANLVPCKNHAACENINDAIYVCKCSGNWTGLHCNEVKTSPTSTTTTATTLAATEATSGHTINITTSLSPSSSGGINGTNFPEIVKDDSGSVVIPVVFVSVVVVIALAVTIFLLWRRRTRRRSLQVTEGNYETKDMNYENLRPDQSAESGYTEFSRNNRNAEETAGSVYQTIDYLPEDQTECNSGYEHLKIDTTKSVDDYYMEVTAHQISRGAPFDATYTNTPYGANGQDEETKHSNAQRTKKMNF